MPAPIVVGDLSGIPEAIGSVGQAFAQALQMRGERQRLEGKRQQQQDILGRTLGMLGKEATPFDIMSSLNQAVAQGLEPETAQRYGQTMSSLLKAQQAAGPGPSEIADMSNLFQKFGMERDMADRNAELWGKLTVGGQTEMAKLLVDQISRQQFKPMEPAPDMRVGGEEIIEEESYKFPPVDIFEDRSPKERANLKGELLKANNEEYKAASTAVRNAQKNVMRYQQLERLNDSGQLPQNLENLNINWGTGEIRYPKLANEATQLYVKTVMDFLSGAKDTFGSRVTNFDVGMFLKRLPTLANTESGRRVIIEQMQALEELNALYDQSIKDTYDNYGTQNIDRANVERIAEDYRADKEAQIKDRFAKAIQKQEIFEAKALSPEGKVAARGPDGKIVYILQSQADKARERGYEVL